MDKRGKVIKGLECCAIDGGCGACPYDSFKDCPGSQPMPETLMKDALALLKAHEQEVVNLTTKIVELTTAQEPRIVTKHDFEDKTKVDSAGGLPVWIEYRREEEWGEYWENTDDEWAIVYAHNFESKSYRCWTARPTDAQREATPWN